MIINLQDAQGWAEHTKLKVSELDTDLLDQIEAEVLGRIGSAYDTSTWITASATPTLVRVAIAKLYIAWTINKNYSEDENNTNTYARKLESNAEMLITGIISGTIELPAPSITTSGQASFYPNDASSALEATWDDGSLGPEKFSMGAVF